MLSPYQTRLRLIRNKQVPPVLSANKLNRHKKCSIINVEKLSYQLLQKQAQLVFNAWIRKRDWEKGCISCRSKKVLHASHYYAAGTYLGLRFHEHNAHGSCENCNTFLYGNLDAYRKELLIRIGKNALAALDSLALDNKRRKYTRSDLMQIITKYRI